MSKEKELEGMTAKQIAKSPRLEPKRTLKLKYRECLSCDDIFLSEGPWNRLCNYCRTYQKKGNLEFRASK